MAYAWITADRQNENSDHLRGWPQHCLRTIRYRLFKELQFVDREDVKYLARTVPLNRDTLLACYREELRPYLSNEARHDLTIDLWVEDYFGP